MAQSNEFKSPKIPRGAYPESPRIKPDAVIPPFKSLPVDLLTFANQGTPEAIYNLKNVLGINGVIAAILALRNPASQTVFKHVDTVYMKLLEHAVFDASVRIGEGQNMETWPESAYGFLIKIGFTSKEIHEYLRIVDDDWLTPAVKRSFNRAAFVEDAALIFDQEGV